MKNLVRHLRSVTGLTQKALALQAGTSQPTIAAYEAGHKSPTLVTAERLAASLGLEMIVSFTPCMTREDRRSLAYHREIAKKLKTHGDTIKRRANITLALMQKRNSGVKRLFEDWHKWLLLPTDELAIKILDPSLHARDMRQVSPFAGVLSPLERVQILKQFRREYG